MIDSMSRAGAVYSLILAPGRKCGLSPAETLSQVSASGRPLLRQRLITVGYAFDGAVTFVHVVELAT